MKVGLGIFKNKVDLFSTAARVISIIFDPALVGSITLLLPAYLSGIYWVFLYLALAIVPTIYLMFRRRRYEGYAPDDKSVRKRRSEVVYVVSITLSLMIIVFNWLGAPPLILHVFYANLGAMIVGGMINKFVTKISGHALYNALFSGVVFVIQPAVGLVAIGSSLLVSWSRLVLKEHSFKQVVLGLIVGFLSVTLSFQIYFD
jgi:membrane-associated phospholipid phosphatase